MNPPAMDRSSSTWALSGATKYANADIGWIQVWSVNVGVIRARDNGCGDSMSCMPSSSQAETMRERNCPTTICLYHKVSSPYHHGDHEEAFQSSL
mmetsp:Transcript_5607/g.16618  ORF Transcript_5607/g.16618 Transcript_5607/m.16618 type:complete len:95 (+) Transcript_5607:88-372(+)